MKLNRMSCLQVTASSFIFMARQMLKAESFKTLEDCEPAYEHYD